MSRTAKRVLCSSLFRAPKSPLAPGYRTAMLRGAREQCLLEGLGGTLPWCSVF